MIYFWFVILLILVAIEFATKKIVTLWFILSGSITFIASFFIEDFSILFGIFAIGGYIFYVITKDIVLRRLEGYNGVDEVIDRIIGKTAIVNEKIEPHRRGQVSIDGKIWKATSNETLPISELVTVVAIDNNIVSVTKWKK